MKLRITKLIMVAAIAALVGIAGSTVAWAQELTCPTSPNYSPDFSLNPGCLILNGSASFPAPTGGVSTITAWSGTGGIVTFTASNSFTAGEPIILSGFATSTYLNGLSFPVLAAGLSSSQFEIAFSGYTGYPGPSTGPDTGSAAPLNLLQLTPNSTDQAGSAWYKTQQSVAGAFSTTFTFQLSGANTGYGPADGIAFVIQNSGTAALGPDGCGMGFADGSCTSSTGGITSSLAVDFKTYNDGYPSPNNNSVSIVSYGTGANCIDQACNIAYNNSLPNGITLADGNIHSVTISYTLQPTLSASPACFANSTPEPCLDVILDGNDLFAGGVQLILNGTSTPLSLAALIGGSNSAWVGFTGATGGGDDNQDILSWTLTPGAESGTATAGTTLDLNFAGGFSPATEGYDANVLLASGSFTVQVSPIVQRAGDSPSCNDLVKASFPGAQCFVYDNADGMGNPGTVMFEYTCPGSQTAGQCGSSSLQNFMATLGSDFFFEYNNNLGLPMPALPPSPYEPLVGYLKGSGPDPLSPCTPYPGNTPPLFQSNQILSFTFPAGDPPGSGKASSQGTGSCWTLTYLTPGEAPSVSISQPLRDYTYQQNQVTSASYTCNAVNEGVSSPTGPYLTVASCSAADSPGGSVNNGTQFDTATLGPHTFTATVVDSAANSVSQTVKYNVVASTDLAIANLALAKVGTGSNLTYAIGVGDLGNATAVNVMVNDTLDPGTSFVSASGSNVACALVNKKVSCQTIPFTCSSGGGSVSCPVGQIYPLSITSLNGAVIKVVVNVTAPAGTTLKNTVTVSAANLDPKQSNNSSTASTTVTAH